MEIELHYCPRCKSNKPTNCFYKNCKRKRGTAIHCIECCKQMYQENREKILLQKQKYHIENIERRKEYSKNYTLLNKELIYTNNKKNYQNNRKTRILKTKTNTYKRKYNITLEEFNQKLTEQDNKCLGCGKIFIDKGDACLDHNHKTGKVRGVLCRNCNWALGHANDDISILKKIIIYLTKHQ